MKNIVCIKWGTKYGVEYVNKLYGMVKRNVTGDFRFICFTENKQGIRPEVEVRDLPHYDGVEGWWYKTWLFSKEFPLTEPTVFLDLDVVIVDNIDCLFNYEPAHFCIIHEWMDKIRQKNQYNSSVFRFQPHQHPNIWKKVVGNPVKVKRDYLIGDQKLIEEFIPDSKPWPADWIVSWKWHCAQKRANEAIIPENAKILVFHGRPNPDEAITGGIGNYPAAPWLKNYWKE